MVCEQKIILVFGYFLVKMCYIVIYETSKQLYILCIFIVLSTKNFSCVFLSFKEKRRKNMNGEKQNFVEGIYPRVST
jgi:F0F1-type ATP synthase membrane subunit a